MKVRGTLEAGIVLNMEEPKGEGPSRARAQLLVLSRRIRGLREKQGMTQEDFAEKCGISVSFASLLERGERSPSYETLLQVAEALDIPVAELFRDGRPDLQDDPYHLRLLEFARTKKLTPAQIDRVLLVAEALFHEMAAAPSRSVTVGPICAQVGCRRPVLAKGLCVAHYHRKRRARR